MLTYLTTASSTNQILLEQNPPVSHGTALYTTHQTEGRGRRGRRWQEQAGENLAFSVAFTEMPLERLSALPLVVGLACRKALSPWVSVGLKWSNDLILEGKKLGGILCESKLQSATAIGVIGVGINLSGTPERFQEQGLPYATALDRHCESMPSAKTVATALHTEILKFLESFVQSGFSPYLQADYEACCVHQGKTVMIYSPNKVREGISRGVNDKGQLLLEANGCLEEISSGEVSLRSSDFYEIDD